MKVTIVPVLALSAALVTASSGPLALEKGKAPAISKHFEDAQADQTGPIPCSATLKVPGPSKLCGFSGSLRRPKPTTHQSVKSLGECAESCLNNPSECASFAFTKGKTHGTCQFYGSPLGTMGYTKASTGKKKFYNSGCYSCTNLLTNGDFQDGTWNPWTSSGAVELLVKGTKAKPYGVFNITSSDEYAAITYPNFNITIGQEYVFSMDYQSTSDNCATYLSMAAGSYEDVPLALGQNTYLTGTSVPLNKWVRYQYSFVAADTASPPTIGTICDNGTTGPVVYFENFSVTPLSSELYSTANTPTGPNILAQPNFESGTLDAYNIFTDDPATEVTIIQPGFGGATYAAQLNFTGLKYARVILIPKAPATKADVYDLNFEYTFANPDPEIECYVSTGTITADFAAVQANTVTYSYQYAGITEVNSPSSQAPPSQFAGVQSVAAGEALFYLVGCNRGDTGNILVNVGSLGALPLS